MEKLKRYISDLLKQGLTPKKVALAITGGLVISTLPLLIIGSTTACCLVFSRLFKLNFGLVQLSNLLAWPLQVLFFIPFLRVAEAIFKFPPIISDYTNIIHLFKTDFWGTSKQLGLLNLAAVGIWCVFSLAVGSLLYHFVLYIVKNKESVEQ